MLGTYNAFPCRASPATAHQQLAERSEEAAKQGADESDLVTEMRTMMMELYVPPSAAFKTLKPSNNLTRRLHQRRRLEVIHHRPWYRFVPSLMNSVPTLQYTAKISRLGMQNVEKHACC